MKTKWVADRFSEATQPNVRKRIFEKNSVCSGTLKHMLDPGHVNEKNQRGRYDKSLIKLIYNTSVCLIALEIHPFEIFGRNATACHKCSNSSNLVLLKCLYVH